MSDRNRSTVQRSQHKASPTNQTGDSLRIGIIIEMNYKPLSKTRIHESDRNFKKKENKGKNLPYSRMATNKYRQTDRNRE